MHLQNNPFALLSAFYFVAWFMLIVLFLLSGIAQVSGGAMVLYLLVKILSALQFSD